MFTPTYHTPITHPSHTHHTLIIHSSHTHCIPFTLPSHSHHTPITHQSHTNHTPITHPSHSHHTPILHPSHTHHTPITPPSHPHHTPITHPSHTHHSPITHPSHTNHRPITHTNLKYHHTPKPTPHPTTPHLTHPTHPSFPIHPIYFTNSTNYSILNLFWHNCIHTYSLYQFRYTDEGSQCTVSACIKICKNFISELKSNMPQCSLKACGGRTNMFKFPLDEIFRQKWILFCCRKPDWSPGPGARLCKAHFDQHSFAPLKRIQLKPGAVPTIKGKVTG